MSRKVTVVWIIGAALALSMLTAGLSTGAAYAQAPGAVQLAANKVVTPTPKTGEDRDKSPSLDQLQAQIRAQQLELEEMRERVRKLEAMLEVVAANQPARPLPDSTSGRTEPSAVTEAVASAPPAGPPAGRDLAKMATTPIPASPRPATTATQDATARELLPDIGQIGAQIGLLVGGSQNPFRSNNGFFTAGYIDLPLKKVPGGKLSYEIMVSMARTTTDTEVTSAAIALVNGALNRELGRPPGVGNLLGPLPVTNKVKERMTTLTVVPLALRYAVTAFDRARIRPYGVIGFGTYVSLTSQNPVDFNAARQLGAGPVADLVNALLSGHWIGGLLPEAPELRARGIANGQGDNRFGVHFGGGIEFRVSRAMSFGVDYRANKIEGRNGGPFGSFSFKQGIHF